MNAGSGDEQNVECPGCTEYLIVLTPLGAAFTTVRPSSHPDTTKEAGVRKVSDDTGDSERTAQQLENLAVGFISLLFVAAILMTVVGLLS